MYRKSAVERSADAERNETTDAGESGSWRKQEKFVCINEKFWQIPFKTGNRKLLRISHGMTFSLKRNFSGQMQMKTPTVGDESSATGRRGKCNFLAQSSVMTLENWAVCWDERGWTSSDKDDEIFRRSLHIIQWTEFNGILVAVFLLYAVVMRNGWLESKAKPLPTTRKLWRVSTCQFTEIVYLYLWSFKMTQSNFCFRVAITDATALNGILDTICDTKACRSKLHYPFAIQILGSGWGGFEYRWGGNTNSERWKVNEMYCISSRD